MSRNIETALLNLFDTGHNPATAVPWQDPQKSLLSEGATKAYRSLVPYVFTLLTLLSAGGCKQGPSAEEIAKALVTVQANAVVTPKAAEGTPIPTAIPTSTPQPAGGEAGVQVVEKAVMPVITVEQALRDAAENYAQKTNGNVDQLYGYITEIYNSLPPMPFVAPGTKGLIPHLAQATSFAGREPSKDPNSSNNYPVQASLRGFYAVSGGYQFAVTEDGYLLRQEWQDKTTYQTFWVGRKDKNTKIWYYDYAPGGMYGIGASYAYNQDAQFPDRRMIDKVWLADGIMQAALRDGPTGKTVVSFVDLASHKVSEFTYQIEPKTWSSRTFDMPRK